MKRVLVLLLAAFMTASCAARGDDTRAEELQERYTAMAGCTARVRVSVTEDGEVRRYTLDVVRDGEETRVMAVEPEALAGIVAVVSGDRLAVAYDDFLLDAGSADQSVSAANAVAVMLDAVAKGWIAERNTERCMDTDALRLRFETEHGGESLSVTAWFDSSDAPLCAEIERESEIFLYLEFTEFAFRDIVNKK